MVQKKLKKNNYLFLKNKKIYIYYLKKKNYNFNINYKINFGYFYNFNDFFDVKYYNKYLNIDLIFRTTILNKFINNLMKVGNKFLAEKFMYKSLQKLKLNLLKNDYSYLFKQKSIIIGKSYNSFNIVFILLNILKVIKIPFEIKNIRIGGKVYQVPILLTFEKQQNKAIKMFVKLLEKNVKQKFEYFFVLEIEKLILNRSLLNRYVFDYYKIVYDNRSYAHYRWF